MPEIIDTIKELSHKIAEDYLLVQAPMTDAVIDLYDSGLIENEEIAKRVCEHANQNVYLAKFHDPNIDKSNIKFELADSKEVGDHIKKSENEMKDYLLPPNDFRNSEPSPVATAAATEVADDSANIKLAALNECQTYLQLYERLHNRMEIIKNAAAAEAEDAFNKMANDAKVMVAGGDSIGDIAKIAARCVEIDGLNMEKVARAYDIIHRELVNSGFHVKTEFTKISSMRVNTESEMLKPVRAFAVAIEKVAAATEMCDGIQKKVDAFSSMIEKAVRS